MKEFIAQFGSRKAAFLATVAVCSLGLIGCSASVTPQPPRVVTVSASINTNRANAKEVREFVVNNGIAAAAEESQNQAVAAGAVIPPQPPATPAHAKVVSNTSVVVGPPIIRDIREAANIRNRQTAIRLTGIRSAHPHPTKEAAISDALQVARLKLMQQLEAQEPAITAKPSLVTMKWEYLKGEPLEVYPTEDEKKALRDSGLSGNLRWVTLDLELNDEQVRSLRASDRVTDAFRVVAVVFALLAALYGFFRLDQWTKGYLTLWLGIGAVVAVIGVILVVA